MRKVFFILCILLSLSISVFVWDTLRVIDIRASISESPGNITLYDTRGILLTRK
jgi:hypothetical protein